jgi:hypothetical protein
MGTNGFREDELASRRVKVNGEWQTRIFPVVGGRLRLAHEENQSLNLQTEMVSWDGQFAIFKCSAVTNKGQFVGYGTANSQRDAKLAESLIELAETRAIARALRFAGYGMEYTGAEEVSHATAVEAEKEQSPNKEPIPLFSEDRNPNKADAKTQSSAVGEKSKSQSTSGGKATTAQVRALYALTKRAAYCDDDIQSLINPFEVSRFEDLPREAASRLITTLQTEVA